MAALTPQQSDYILQLLVQYGPGLALEVVNLLQAPAPTPADWSALLTKINTPITNYQTGTLVP